MSRWLRSTACLIRTWVIGTTEEGKTCKDLVGQDIVDPINGARSVALRRC